MNLIRSAEIGRFQPTNTHRPLSLPPYLSYPSPTREAAATKHIIISSIAVPVVTVHSKRSSVRHACVARVLPNSGGWVRDATARTVPAVTAARRRQRLSDASPARLFAHGRKVFLFARRKVERALEARDEGQAVGWGQPHSGAYRTREDGCEETAEAERCKPGAPLGTWTNGEEVRSFSCLRGPR